MLIFHLLTNLVQKCFAYYFSIQFKNKTLHLRTGLGNVLPAGHMRPRSLLMWPASYICYILDGDFDVENKQKTYLS